MHNRITFRHWSRKREKGKKYHTKLMKIQSHRGKLISIFADPTKQEDNRQIYIVRICFMHTKNLPHVDRDKKFFFTSILRFLWVKLSVCGNHPKGSVKIETSLLLPKQLIHRKGNCPLLNFLSILLTVSMIRREKLPWTVDITERKRGEKRANAWINLQGTFGRNITILNIYISRKTLDFAIELIVRQFTFT